MPNTQAIRKAPASASRISLPCATLTTFATCKAAGSCLTALAWRACHKEHIEAAERVIEEAQQDYVALAVREQRRRRERAARLATLEPEMRQAVKLAECEPGLLGEKGWRQ